MANKSAYSHTRLSDNVFRIVEADKFNENPFIYLIFGDNRAAVVDTGCGTGNLLQYLRTSIAPDCNAQQVNLLNHSVICINSHNHYDHVGGNYQFSDHDNGPPPGVVDLCASSLNIDYTSDQFNSLGWYVGCAVKPFKITRWLDDGEVIPLSGSDEAQSLQVIHSPGHSPDSLCLYYPKDNRMFVGDVIYRHSPVLAVGIQSCPVSFENSLKKLTQFGKHNRPVLSCGHIDDNLEFDYLSHLNDLFKQINGGSVRPLSSYSWFAEYSMNESNLSVCLRRYRLLDSVLKPIVKLFFR